MGSKGALWQNLVKIAREPQPPQLGSYPVGDWRVDLSRQSLSLSALTHLGEYLQQQQFSVAQNALYRGGNSAAYEQAPAHVRWRSNDRVLKEWKQMDALNREKVSSLMARVESGEITDVICVGWGGSHWGASLAYEAFHLQARCRCHFWNMMDSRLWKKRLSTLDLSRTVWVWLSKSFQTVELRAIRQHVLANYDITVDQQWVVTADLGRAVSEGLLKSQTLLIPDSMGGRFSIWSAMALPLWLAFGWEWFEKFFQGAQLMDAHYMDMPLWENVPVLLALVDIWHGNFMRSVSHAVLVYDSRLSHWLPYMQQLHMESLGKTVGLDSRLVMPKTSAVYWGGQGVDSQHTFMQLLYQGSHSIPIDMLWVEDEDVLGQQAVSYAKSHAQSLWENTVGVHHQPITALSTKALTPSSLGQLLALYEHKVFTQSVFWQIDAFTQPGIEAGKLALKNAGVAELV